MAWSPGGSSSTTSDAERLVAKFCACLDGHVRLELPRRVVADSSVSTDVGGGDGVPWICIRFDDAASSTTRQGSDSEQQRRCQSVRAKLEALSILSAVASLRAFSWNGNPRFWRQFLDVHCHGAVGSTKESATTKPQHGGEIVMPKFLLDFSYMHITSDLIALCCAFLTGRKRKARKTRPHGMRSGFIAAMDKLDVMAAHSLQKSSYHRIQIGFLLNRCELQQQLVHVPSMETETARSTKQSTMATTADAGKNAVKLLQELIDVISTRAAWMAQFTHKPTALSPSNNPKCLDPDPAAWNFFYYDVAILDLSASRLAKSDFARLAQLVAALPGSLRELVLNKVISETDAKGYAASFGTLMTELFAVENDSGDESTPSKSSVRADLLSRNANFVERFTFDWNLLNVGRVSSLFSAIHTSSGTRKSVKELSLIGAFRRFDGAQCLPWAWLTFGVFHHASKCRLQSLDISCNVLTHDAVNAMMRVLTMANYANELLGVHTLYTEHDRIRNNAARTTPDRWCGARLKEHATLWPTKQASDTEIALKLNDESAWFEVLQHSKRWMCVLVPGYGALWTHSKSVLAIETRHQQVRRGAASSLKTLRLNALVHKDTERVSHVLRELFPLIGASLQHLELRDNLLSNVALTAIMKCCPHLLHLDVSDCELITIAAITDAYEHNETRLRSLVLTENHVKDRDIRRLMALLRCTENKSEDNNSSPSSNEGATTPICSGAAMHLAYLDVDQNPIGRLGLMAIGKALQVNKTALSTVILSKKEDPDGLLRGRFAIYENEPLAVQPLGLQERLAVLSVEKQCGTQSLDAVVLQQIFAFAAQQVLLPHRYRERDSHSAGHCCPHDVSGCASGGAGGWRRHSRRRRRGVGTGRRRVCCLDGAHRSITGRRRAGGGARTRGVEARDAALFAECHGRVHELAAQRDADAHGKRAVGRVERQDRLEQRHARVGGAHGRELRVRGRVRELREHDARRRDARRQVRVLRQRAEPAHLALGERGRRRGACQQQHGDRRKELHINTVELLVMVVMRARAARLRRWRNGETSCSST
ncbi:hypothetical protein FI667_g6029, partial [Globisporangium splendens]